MDEGEIRCGDQRDPGKTDRLKQRTSRNQKPLAEPVDKPAADRGEHEQCRGPRQQTQPGVERAERLRGLQELRQKKHHAVHRGVEQQARSDPGAEGAIAKQPHRHHRRRRPRLPANERDCKDQSHAQRGADFTAGPADMVAAHQRPDDGKRGHGYQQEPGHIERGSRAEAFRAAAKQQQDDHAADRQVDPEDPLPGEAAGDRAADHRTGDQGEAGDAAEQAQHAAALLPRKRGTQQRHRQRHDQRRADALDGSCRDQCADVAGERAPGRRCDENSEP